MDRGKSMRVLLATDGSQCAVEAAWLLAHLPHADSLELTVIFVSNIPNLHGAGDIVELTRRLEMADKEKARAIFAHLQGIFEGANAMLKLVVGTGHIGTQILQAAEAGDCDLIVLGAVGHSLFERMFGSTSDFVATHAKCSVLVVRPTGLKTAKRPIDIAIAYDETESSSAIFGQLSQFGWGPNSKIELVNVVSMPLNYTEIPIPIDFEAIMSLRNRELDVAANRFRQLSPTVSTHVFEANHVGDGIVRFVKKFGSDIIVLGNTGGGLLSSILLGSVSKYVLRHSECSVWITRKNSKAINGLPSTTHPAAEESGATR